MERDANFLKSQGLMDYSLLLGVSKLDDQTEASFIESPLRPPLRKIFYIQSMKNEKYFITKERPQFSKKLEEKNFSY